MLKGTLITITAITLIASTSVQASDGFNELGKILTTGVGAVVGHEACRHEPGFVDVACTAGGALLGFGVGSAIFHDQPASYQLYQNSFNSFMDGGQPVAWGWGAPGSVYRARLIPGEEVFLTEPNYAHLICRSYRTVVFQNGLLIANQWDYACFDNGLWLPLSRDHYAHVMRFYRPTPWRETEIIRAHYHNDFHHFGHHEGHHHEDLHEVRFEDRHEGHDDHRHHRVVVEHAELDHPVRAVPVVPVVTAVQR